MSETQISKVRRPSDRRPPLLTSFRITLGLGLLVTALALGREATPKLILLGFDGADAELTRRWMDQGVLPHLAALRTQGCFGPLRSTVPSQTPVSWSSLATGLNPGRHGIFDFLKRDPATYRPGFAAFEEVSVPFLLGRWNPAAMGLAGMLMGLLGAWLLTKRTRWRPQKKRLLVACVGLSSGLALGFLLGPLLPAQRPEAVNRRQGDTFWEVLGAAGKRVKVMRMPVTFPPKPFENGCMLSGLGTPDLSFRVGKPFYFTSELFFRPRAGGEFSVEVVELSDNRGTIHTEIVGPPNKLFPDGAPFLKIPMSLRVAENREQLTIALPDREVHLKPGQWSDWIRFSFAFNPLVKLNGIGRFRLLELDKEVRLYLSPIMFDPEKLPPGMALTAPADFVDRLTEEYGLFKTIGWAIDTWSMAEGTIDEAVFLEDVNQTVTKYRQMLMGLLAEDDWDVLFHYFEFTDRVQHVMWRHFDPQHPLYKSRDAARWGGAILEAYEEMDRIVGEVSARKPEDAVLMVVSDHGFSSFRRAMNYNTWLVENGYMHLNKNSGGRRNVEDLFENGPFFTHVDWSRTRAYALGLGQIYINLKGREGQGIVAPGNEYDSLIREIASRLTAFEDEGSHPVAHVYTRDEIYHGYDPDLVPDLIPANSEGYRVGWQDSLGGIAPRIVEDNLRIWSGDHCSVYGPLVEGILFSSIKLNHESATMVDIMPTLLALLQVAASTELDGRSLLPED